MASSPSRVTIISALARFCLFFLFLILTVGLIHQVLARPKSRSKTYPQMRAGAPFKIAIFADLHYGENGWTDWGPRQDVNSTRVMSTVLDAETPDFVIYLGDVITANNMPIANASLYWDQAISPTTCRGIPFASVFGNHDDAPFEWPTEWFSAPGIPQLVCPAAKSTCSGEEACSFRGTPRLELMKHELDQNVPSFSQNGPTELWPSVSNYVLPVSSSASPKTPVVYLYFLDSGGGSYPEIISSAQVDWFQNKSAEINPDSRESEEGKRLIPLRQTMVIVDGEVWVSFFGIDPYHEADVVPELIFWHIPSQAYKNVAPRFGIHQPCVGLINKESVAPQEAETGIMNLLVKRPSVKAIFVGHNHGLDWCCPYEKLWLCFARHTGYGGYGSWARGARIVEITQQPFSVKSWIRMEDNVVHSRVDLSS